MKQGTDEWLRARYGKITASNVHKVLSTNPGKFTQTAISYMNQLIAERLIKPGEMFECFDSVACQWGKDNEPEAAAIFKSNHPQFAEISETGFHESKNLIAAGCSPDLIIKNHNGEIISGVEIKCPYNPANYIESITTEMKKEYYAQIQFSMYIMEVACWYYVCYHPYLEPGFHVQLINRNDVFIDDMINQCKYFLNELDSRIRLIVPRHDEI